MAFVKIEPGAFMMGTTAKQQLFLQSTGLWDPVYKDELPAHRVAVTEGFYMGTYEVTQEQCKTVMDTRPWVGEPYRPGHAVVRVTWDQVPGIPPKCHLIMQSIYLTRVLECLMM